MRELISHPPLLFFVFLGTLWLAALLGTSLRKRYPLSQETREDFGVVLAASLTLLGLIIGFAFSMSTGRYDQRKNYEEAEANAIGTEYVRASLLTKQEAAGLRVLLVSYLDERIKFYTVREDDEIDRINNRTTKIQSDMWSAVLVPAAARPTPITALVVSGMNDVLNSQGYTQAAWWNRIPVSAWILMTTIAMICNFMVNYGARSVLAGTKLPFILPLLISVAFALIADIDAPRHGVIQVKPQNLINLASSISTT